MEQKKESASTVKKNLILVVKETPQKRALIKELEHNFVLNMPSEPLLPHTVRSEQAQRIA